MKEIFENKEQVKKWFLKNYPRGTDRENITEIEGVVQDETGVWKLFDAPNHIASRHFVDLNGNRRSAGVKQSWMVIFLFNKKTKLKGVDAFLISRKN